MRKSKLAAASSQRAKIVSHTRAERLALRRKNRKEGPSGRRRAEKRRAIFGAPHVVHLVEVTTPNDDGQVSLLMNAETGEVLGEIRTITPPPVTDDIQKQLDDAAPIWDAATQSYLPSKNETERVRGRGFAEVD